ncbi:MAG: secondary thiamine-phosphate synthase enzyme YjbQ [Thermoanaerobaculia bacterium]
MRCATFSISTSAHDEAVLVTRQVEEVLASKAPDAEGICTIFTPHTTAALTINEDADPDVRTDLVRAFRAMVPAVRFDHAEGNSDAHFLSALIGVSLQVPFRNGKLLLGRWQGIWFLEFDGPRRREVQVWVASQKAEGRSQK